jgi:hypothetical protein
MNLFKRHYPLLIILAAYGILFIALLTQSLRACNDIFVYEVDDAYIHMAIARNLALFANWGVNAHEFSSTSSSPLWTILLASINRTLGIHDLTPLILNLFLSLLLLFSVYALLHRRSATKLLTTNILLLLIFITPLPELTLSGMEHVLHALVTVFFSHQAARFISQLDDTPTSQQVLLLVLAMLLTSVRYEGLFTVLPILILLFLNGRWKYAVLLAGVSVLPMILIGVWSLSHGWYFLPNALMIKPSLPETTLKGLLTYLLSLLEYARCNTQIIVLFIMILMMLRQVGFRLQPNYRQALLLITSVSILCQIILKIGWFYRYHSYLITLALFAIANALTAQRPFGKTEAPTLFTATRYKKNIVRSLLIPALSFVLAAPLAIHAVASLVRTPLATQNTYEQEYLPAKFLERYYKGKTIAATDIGAIAYYSNAYVVDLWGLGTLEPAQLKRADRYGKAEISHITQEKGVSVAVLYDAWLEEYGGAPNEWEKAGQWTVTQNIFASLKGNTLGFYAVRPQEFENLIRNLRTFSSALPPTIEQSGKYTLLP